MYKIKTTRIFLAGLVATIFLIFGGFLKGSAMEPGKPSAAQPTQVEDLNKEDLKSLTVAVKLTQFRGKSDLTTIKGAIIEYLQKFKDAVEVDPHFNTTLMDLNFEFELFDLEDGKNGLALVIYMYPKKRDSLVDIEKIKTDVRNFAGSIQTIINDGNYWEVLLKLSTDDYKNIMARFWNIENKETISNGVIDNFKNAAEKAYENFGEFIMLTPQELGGNENQTLTNRIFDFGKKEDGRAYKIDALENLKNSIK